MGWATTAPGAGGDRLSGASGSAATTPAIAAAGALIAGRRLRKDGARRIDTHKQIARGRRGKRIPAGHQHAAPRPARQALRMVGGCSRVVLIRHGEDVAGGDQWTECVE